MRRSHFRALFSVSGDNPDLVRAQHQAFLKQIPLLYFILSTNSIAVAYSFYGVAPDFLALHVPGVLCVFCVVRLVWWVKHRKDVISHDVALAHLQRANRLAVILTVAFTTWGLALSSYGNPYAQGQVAFFIALTMIGCIFCLMHVRAAALSVVVLANIPYFTYYMLDGQPNMRAMAVNLMLVSVAMVVVTMVYYRDFANLVDSRSSLQVKQQETERLSDENLKLANLDALTDLPNRRRFFTSLNKAVGIAKATQGRLAIGVIDLDGFKPVNDTYGHIVGDRLLFEMARRLGTISSDAVEFYRLGGDEFAVIVTGEASETDLRRLGRTINSLVRTPFNHRSVQLAVGCTIGFAVFPDSADATMRLYERADYALYFAKRHARGEVVLFSQEHEDRIRSDGKVEFALHAADFDEELTLMFQPIVDTRQSRVVAFEALARWNSSTLGPVSPAVFIPIAERIGLVRAMTKVLLRKALAAAALWPDNVKLSFNLSVHDISNDEAVLQIVNIINKSGVDPKRIDFEITETALSFDFEQARATVKALKALGVGVSLDDFGTGYSSLTYLRTLSLDRVKIDRSFVSDICSSKVSHDIIKALQGLCADLGLNCVAEGVESADQVEALASVGCYLLQGYHFARPLSEEAAAAFLRSDLAEQAAVA